MSKTLFTRNLGDIVIDARSVFTKNFDGNLPPLNSCLHPRERWIGSGIRCAVKQCAVCEIIIVEKK